MQTIVRMPTPDRPHAEGGEAACASAGELPPSLRRDIVTAALAVCAVLATALVSAFAMFPDFGPWYASLGKPSWHPPEAVQRILWSCAYALMALAFWRLLRKQTPGRLRHRAIAIGAMLVLLATNAAWAWMLFGGQSTLLGMIGMAAQLVCAVATIVLFARANPFAALCLVPVALWLAFLALLAVVLWHQNW